MLKLEQSNKTIKRTRLIQDINQSLKKITRKTPARMIFMHARNFLPNKSGKCQIKRDNKALYQY